MSRANFSPRSECIRQWGATLFPKKNCQRPPDAAILSDGFWRRRYGADPNIIGKKLTIGGNPTIVIGVLPAGFRFPEVKADIWELASLHPEQKRRGRYMAQLHACGRA